MDKVNLKYVPNSSSSSHNNNNNNPEDVLKVVKISPLQDFLMKFAPALKRNSVMKTMWRKKRVKVKINIDWIEHVFSSTFTILKR